MLQQQTKAYNDPFAETDSESALDTYEEFSEDDGSSGSSNDDDKFEFPSSDEGELITYGSAEYPIMV